MLKGIDCSAFNWCTSRHNDWWWVKLSL